MCQSCGADDFFLQENFLTCKFCNSRFTTEESKDTKSSKISLSDDIQVLLEKCKKDPLNAQRYIGLILDIDPTNVQVKNYL